MEANLYIEIDLARLRQILESIPHPCESSCEYGRYCPVYWRIIFTTYFGNEPRPKEGVHHGPRGDTDPRWFSFLNKALWMQGELLGYRVETTE